MKVDKRVVLSSAVVLGVAALIAGSTIAYFTDKDTKDNHFTVGGMDITLYESQLHRENSGRMGNFPALASDPDYCDWVASSNVTTTAGNASLINGSYENARYCTPNQDVEVAYADGISAVANGHTASNRGWGYSDAYIKADAETYDDIEAEDGADGYFARASKNIVPGQWVRKFAYVVNEDESSDAYILVRYMVPTEYAHLVDLKVPGTPYEEDTDATKDGVQGYFTAVIKGANGYEAYTGNIDDYTGYTDTVDGDEYRVYAAVTTNVVKPGEMTFWSPINTVRLKTDAQITDRTATETFVATDAIDVKVDAQGIQAKTFVDGIEAIKNLQ